MLKSFGFIVALLLSMPAMAKPACEVPWNLAQVQLKEDHVTLVKFTPPQMAMIQKDFEESTGKKIKMTEIFAGLFEDSDQVLLILVQDGCVEATGHTTKEALVPVIGQGT